MQNHSTKPYLMRAIYEWCIDHGFTPHLLVAVNDTTRVPMQFVKDGHIVLNISAGATRDLKMDNDWVMFSARFGGVAHEISVPVDRVAAVFARETGDGLHFEMADGDAPADVIHTQHEEFQDPPAQGEDPDKPPRGRPHLQVVK
jgi:stringent starvation protein B